MALLVPEGRLGYSLACSDRLLKLSTDSQKTLTGSAAPVGMPGSDSCIWTVPGVGRGAVSRMYTVSFCFLFGFSGA